MVVCGIERVARGEKPRRVRGWSVAGSRGGGSSVEKCGRVLSCLVLSCICVVSKEDARGGLFASCLGAAAVTRGWYREGPAGLKHGEERGE